jgi:hypothetical protein
MPDNKFGVGNYLASNYELPYNYMAVFNGLSAYSYLR